MLVVSTKCQYSSPFPHFLLVPCSPRETILNCRYAMSYQTCRLARQLAKNYAFDGCGAVEGLKICPGAKTFGKIIASCNWIGAPKPPTGAAAVGYSCASAPYGTSVRVVGCSLQRCAWRQKSTRLRASCEGIDRDSFKRCRRLQSSNRWNGGFLPFFYAHDFAVPTYNRFLVSFGAGDP